MYRENEMKKSWESFQHQEQQQQHQRIECKENYTSKEAWGRNEFLNKEGNS